jgi:glutamate-1-semialdehyde 2,1-aminomutase
MNRSIDRRRLFELIEREEATFDELHPTSKEMALESAQVLLRGVPMSWMSRWPGSFPVFFQEAHGSALIDVDGNTYVDFCLGDTGAMAGHAPAAVADAVDARYRRGSTAMLPSADATWVARELGRRFGLPIWQFALTATDANRWAIRLARQLTHRPYILVFNRCYHGTVDEAGLYIDERGAVRKRHGNVGPPVDPSLTTKVVEFNDVAALERALTPQDVACVLTEPVLTNIGIVHPDQGFHDALRETTRANGTLLVIDETQTQSSGPGGYSRVNGLEPDMLTIGKAIGGGIPIGALGLRQTIADQIERDGLELADEGAVGGTLAGNALSMAAARATLEHVLTELAFDRMLELSEALAASVEAVIHARRLSWHVARVGARAEYRYSSKPARSGGESALADDPMLDRYMHTFMMNRGILTTPFHNMSLMSPESSRAGSEAFVRVFAQAVDELPFSD